jgi:hypothetical protein
MVFSKIDVEEESGKLRWKNGKLGKDLNGLLTLNGSPLTKERKRHRCGHIVDYSKLADDEFGIRIINKLKPMADRLDERRKFAKLAERAQSGKAFLDDVLREYIKIFKRHNAEMDAPVEFTEGEVVHCPHCQLSLGRLAFTVSYLEPLPVAEIAKSDLIKLRLSPKMEAVASKRMGFASVEELQMWLDDEEREKAKEILTDAIEKLRDLVLDYDTSSIIGAIERQIDEIDAETKRRKVGLVDAVEVIVREQTPVIR